MNVEDYVNFKTAKKMKEKGYDHICSSFYDKKGSVYIMSQIGQKEMAKYGYMDDCSPRATLYEAQKWLREQHDIDVLPCIRTESISKDYCCNIYKNSKLVSVKVAYGNDFYECMNDSILEAIKFI